MAPCRLPPELASTHQQEAVHEALGCGVGCDDASTASEHRHNRRGGRGGTHLVRAAAPALSHRHSRDDAFTPATSIYCHPSCLPQVVSFHRKTLGQTGEGHFSPLGGYSRRHNAVLVMDVARFKCGQGSSLLPTAEACVPLRLRRALVLAAAWLTVWLSGCSQGTHHTG